MTASCRYMTVLMLLFTQHEGLSLKRRARFPGGQINVVGAESVTVWWDLSVSIRSQTQHGPGGCSARYSPHTGPRVPAELGSKALTWQRIIKRASLQKQPAD